MNYPEYQEQGSHGFKYVDVRDHTLNICDGYLTYADAKADAQIYHALIDAKIIDVW